jgi:AcrR family transcriptional regulator
MPEANSGRAAQRARTRREIVRAAGRLLERGERPGLDEVAAEAGVSRATAYRYFPGVDALLSEAAVDALMPDHDSLLGPEAPADPLARLLLVDAAIDHAARTREVPLRLMLAQTLERSVREPEAIGLRQNRRSPLLERALEPLAGELPRAERERLVHALSMVVGTEGLIALKDVVGLDETAAREVRRWAIEALLNAARAP